MEHASEAADMIRHYARQPHTQITVAGNGATGAYPGRTTEVILWATLGGHYLEINQFETPEAEEPKQHELLFFPTNVSIESVRDPEPIDAAPLPHDNGQQVQDAAPKEGEGDDTAAGHGTVH